MKFTEYAEDFATNAEAIKAALSSGYAINKYSDPEEDAREALTAVEAVEVASEDPNLLWLEPGKVTKIVVRKSTESVDLELADAYTEKLAELLAAEFPGVELDLEVVNASGSEVAVYNINGEMDPEGYEAEVVFALSQRAYEEIL